MWVMQYSWNLATVTVITKINCLCEFISLTVSRPTTPCHLHHRSNLGSLWLFMMSVFRTSGPKQGKLIPYWGIIMGMCSANERRRYDVMPSFISLAHSQMHIFSLWMRNSRGLFETKEKSRWTQTATFCNSQKTINGSSVVSMEYCCSASLSNLLFTLFCHSASNESCIQYTEW